MNIKETLINIIEQKNLIDTCENILNMGVIIWHEDEDLNWDMYFQNIPEKLNNKQRFVFVLKEWILDKLTTDWFKSYHNVNELAHDLSHLLQSSEILNILEELAKEKKIVFGKTHFELFPLEQKRRELIKKIQNATEEELDKLL